MSYGYNFSEEDLKNIQAFMESGDIAALDRSAAARLANLSTAVNRRIADSAASLAKKTASLERKLLLYQAKEHLEVLKEGYPETGLDSCDVAMALLHCLQNQHTYNAKLTKNKVIYILYAMYCSWLAAKGERLFVEHPVCTEWGPQFWRVYKRLNPGATADRTAFTRLAEQNAAVAAFTRNSAAKYYDYGEGDLKKLFTKSLPYRNAMPENNGGKWNGQISDGDIVAWKKENN